MSTNINELQTQCLLTENLIETMKQVTLCVNYCKSIIDSIKEQSEKVKSGNIDIQTVYEIVDCLSLFETPTLKLYKFKLALILITNNFNSELNSII